MMSLGYEQYLVLKSLRDNPDQEGTVVCKACECSWDELIALARGGFVDLGMGRLQPNSLHPTITEKGRDEVRAAEVAGLF